MRNTFSLLFLLLSCLCANAQGAADLGTMEYSTDYEITHTSAAGWMARNSIVFNQTVENYTGNYPMLNGKMNAAGTLTSPTLSGGVNEIKIMAASVYKADKKFSFTADIIQNGISVATKQFGTSYEPSHTTVYEFTFDEIDIKGDFSIVITNDCPSQSTKNTDRVAILAIRWTAPEGGQTIEVENFNALADVYDTLGCDFKFSLEGSATVTYQNGDYLYVKCSDSFGLLYGMADAEYKPGYTFSHLEGTFTYVDGIAAVKDYTIGGEISMQEPVAPHQFEDFAIVNSMPNHYVTLQNAMVKDNKATDADGNAIEVKNIFDGVETANGKADLTGFIAVTDNGVCIFPTESILKLAGLSYELTTGTIYAKFEYVLHANNYDAESDSYAVELYVNDELADSNADHTLLETQPGSMLREKTFDSTHRLGGTVKATGLTGGTDYAARLVTRHGADIVDEQAVAFKTGGTVGIGDIAAEAAAAEYFDLQGMRIDNPRAGSVYIVRRGAAISKELLK